MIVVTFNFRQVVMPTFHVYMIAVHIHEHRTLFGVLEWFCCTMVHMDMDRFIRVCAYLQFVNLCSRYGQHMLHVIYSDTPFDVVFLEFWASGKSQTGIYIASLYYLWVVWQYLGYQNPVNWRKSHHNRSHNGSSETFCSIWDSQNDVCGCRCNFCSDLQEKFPGHRTHTSTCICRG